MCKENLIGDFNLLSKSAQEELQAISDYRDRILQTEDLDLKALFEELANEESEHFVKLTKAIQRVDSCIAFHMTESVEAAPYEQSHN